MNVLFDSNLLVDVRRKLPAAKAELKRYAREGKSIGPVAWIEVTDDDAGCNDLGHCSREGWLRVTRNPRDCPEIIWEFESSTRV